MEPFSPYPELTERMTSLWERAMRIAARFALAFGLAAVSAIAVAIAVADNLFGQIFLVLFTTLALWIPYVLVLTMFDQWRARPRRVKASEAVVTVSAKPDVSAFERDWQRLVALAPQQGERLAAIKSSIDRSRASLGDAALDPDAHDLCVLIDRRLPELVAHELHDLPPDDHGRRKQVDGLIDLVEQFARHCGRQREGASGERSREAEILRRRFEARLAEHSPEL
ncbi:hypothetical protein [Sphingomonas mesophila]|uniref:hypothetical protein n=1 Tax=Sphingomonas mesophila TaxID=2303576 RepID=UPI000E59620F|nr:hypothetical protein [Sphingomonas mesophila]